jgi:hypothetical protein
MKYRYIIVDEDGAVSGTNDKDLAMLYTEAAVVIDAKEGRDLELSEPIPEAAQLVELEDEDEDASDEE